MKQFQSETSGATSGLRPPTWRSPPFPVRLIGFAIAVGVVAFVIVRVDVNIWQAQERLGEGFAAIKAEKFYVGMNFRTGLRKLTSSLLDFRLTGNSSDHHAFNHDARELKEWLHSKSGAFISPQERTALRHLEGAYEAFLTRVNPLLETNSPSADGSQGFAAGYSQIREASQPVLEACEELVDAEHGGFDVFLRDSEQALAALQRLFLMSLLLLAALAVALAVLVYRGMIAPLRARLTESEIIIERQEKLASLGALGAGVAHELRNPLTAIKFRLFSLKKSLPNEFTNNEDALVISEEINRLDHIVKDFLQFARPSEPELVRVPAQRILKAVQELMKPELDPTGIDLKLDIVQPPWIEADTAQMKQVLINLVQNSAESIGRHGSVTLRLTRGVADLNGKSKAAAVLAVADTGKGIPPEVQKRLFDPFFTTKDGGTGLGLAIAARIVEKHGGLLRYKTELNRGTIFEVVLPELKDHGS